MGNRFNKPSDPPWCSRPSPIEESSTDEDTSAEDDEPPYEYCPNFEGFMGFAELANSAVKATGKGEETMVLTFHPNATFYDVPMDPAEFALRAPFPTLHLLRMSDVEHADAICESKGSTTDDISMENEARLRGVGYAELSEMLQHVLARAKSPSAAP